MTRIMTDNSRRPLTMLVAVLAMLTAVSLLLAVKPAQAAENFTVNITTDTDDGFCGVAHCSLREAIIAANAASGPDTIKF
jgi:CSLREA domain-containing protein